jgi:hypothetical protein
MLNLSDISNDILDMAIRIAEQREAENGNTKRILQENYI